jgi:hypothetical protein
MLEALGVGGCIAGAILLMIGGLILRSIRLLYEYERGPGLINAVVYFKVISPGDVINKIENDIRCLTIKSATYRSPSTTTWG